MKFPGSTQLAEADPYANVARGQQVTVDTSRNGTIDTGSTAWPERIREAQRAWPQGRPEDFEPLDQRGNLFRDRATNTVYRRLSGAPVLAIGEESTRGASLFIVRAGEIIVLRPAPYEPNLYGATGYIYGEKLTPENRGPELRIL